MIDDMLLEEFGEEMKKILEAKLPEYQDTWKTVPLGTLKHKLIKQLGGVVFYISDLLPKELAQKVDIEHRNKMKRKLLHIANYCFFLYSRLKEREDIE